MKKKVKKISLEEIARKEDVAALKTDIILLKNDFKKLTNILEPILEAYQSATSIGKWIMKVILGISLITGIIWGWINILRRK